MATMDPGQRGFGQQQRFNIPNLPFKDMRRQGPVDRFDESVGEATRGMPSMGPFADRLKRLFPQGQMPPELLQMLMAQLMARQGGGRAGPQRGTPLERPKPPFQRGSRERNSARRARGAPMQRPLAAGGGRPPMGRPPMGGQGGGRPPVIKIEDLVRALSGGGAQRQAPQANMPVPQARR